MAFTRGIDRSSSALFLHFFLFCLLLAVSAGRAHAQSATDLAELRTRLLEAEARQALAEAERAELLARLPPAQSKPLTGSIDTRQFGAAGLVRAFDLARELAATLCARLPANRSAALYDPATSQGMVAARSVDSALTRFSSDMAERNKALQRYLDTQRPPGSGAAALPLAILTVVPATVRAGADIAALLRSDVSATGIGYGEGARAACLPAPWRRPAPSASADSGPATWANSTGHATKSCWGA